jgi:hypothetical protein
MPIDPDTAELAIRTAISTAYERSACVAEDLGEADVAVAIRAAARTRGLTVEEWWVAAQRDVQGAVAAQEHLREMIGKVEDPCKFATVVIASLVELAPLLPLADDRRDMLEKILAVVQRDLLLYEPK